MGTVTVVWAREPIPVDGPSVFLAGPTPRARTRTWWKPTSWRPPVESWRPAALAELTAAWAGSAPLTVLTPESRGGVRAAHYDHQFQWETAARAAATCVLFWIPRDLAELPGFTTNVEFGHDVRTGRAVLGCPPGCPNPERNLFRTSMCRLSPGHGVRGR
ncbi:MAG: nucleoside 2-deoxyribosyltransferase domain-containing protein [Pseudonocardiaceae bacterium]